MDELDERLLRALKLNDVDVYEPRANGEQSISDSEGTAGCVTTEWEATVSFSPSFSIVYVSRKNRSLEIILVLLCLASIYAPPPTNPGCLCIFRHISLMEDHKQVLKEF
jgi:hypothetical protein